MKENRFETILGGDGHLSIDLYDSEQNKFAIYNSDDNFLQVSPDYEEREIDSIESLMEIFEKELASICDRFVVEVDISGTDTFAKFDSKDQSVSYHKWGLGDNQTGDQELFFMRLYRQIGKSLDIKIDTILPNPPKRSTSFSIL